MQRNMHHGCYDACKFKWPVCLKWLSKGPIHKSGRILSIFLYKYTSICLMGVKKGWFAEGWSTWMWNRTIGPANSSMDYELCFISRLEHLERQHYNAAGSVWVEKGIIAQGSHQIDRSGLARACMCADAHYRTRVYKHRHTWKYKLMWAWQKHMYFWFYVDEKKGNQSEIKHSSWI